MNPVNDFLVRHSLYPASVDPVSCSDKMLRHMKAGLAGEIIDMPMIPTYLKGVGTVPFGKKAIVIDAGGTNYRCAVAYFDAEGCHVENVRKCKMPGTESEVTWDEFISFVADSIMPFTEEADVVGFCFSYNADITPDMDGVVERIDKEVVVKGCEGKHIGASLLEELGRRGVYGKRVVILNDTVAALLGGSAMLDKSKYSDFIGMICGTGANTCASVSLRQIGKLHNDADGSMLINLESGSYNGMPCGDVDDAVDAASHQPGEKRMEKMCSGAYIGEVCRMAMKQAVAEGLIPESVFKNSLMIEPLNGAVVDNWACGNDPYHVFENAEQLSFARELCLAIFERSARCMATNILTILRLNGTGRTPDKPACICAEGSLVARSRYFLLFFQKSLNELNDGPDPRYVDVVLGNDTTLPGSAVAVLLNT